MLLTALILAPTTLVDFTTVAKPMSSVLRELSDVVGEDWRATKSLDNELLVIRVRGVAPDELRKHIGEAVAGKWSQEDKAWILKPDQALLRRRSDLLRKEYAKQLGEATKEFYDGYEAESRPPTDEDILNESVSGDGRPNVAGRVLAHALRQLNYYEVAGWQDGERADYSTANNRYQRPLRGLSALLRESLALQHKYADAAMHADVEEPEVGTYLYSVRQTSLRKWPGPIRAVMSLTWEYGSLFASCCLIDASGRVVDTAGFDFLYEPEDPIQIPDVLAKPDHRFSPDTVSFETFFDEPTRSAPENFDQKFLARLKKPTVNDPLSFTVSESLLEIGRLCDWDVVARPVDDMYHGDVLKNGWILGNWLTDVDRMAALDVSHQDGWLTIGPAGYRSRPQIDRTALETLIQQGRDRVQTLAEMSAYSLVSTDNLLELLYITPFAQFTPDWTWLKLYAKLPEDIRLLLWKGVPVPIQSLPSDARSYIEWIAFNTDGFSPLEVDETDWTYEAAPITELLHNGFPRGMFLQPTAVSDFCALSTKPRSRALISYVQPLDRIAERAASRQVAEGAATATFPWQSGPYLFGKSRELTLGFRIGELEYEDTLTDVDLSRRSKEYSGPDLPEDVLKRFDEAAKRHFKKLRDDGG
ncbi:MAG: hypothetical protein M3R13_02445 [Armatimonadota bacterium]|nr:hypothetical protein [Armatimonadota bacterium]